MLGPISIKYGQENARDKYAWAPSEGSLQAYFYDGDVNIVLKTQAKDFDSKLVNRLQITFGVDVTAGKSQTPYISRRV